MVGAPSCSSVLSRSTLRTASSSPISVRLWPSVRASMRATGGLQAWWVRGPQTLLRAPPAPA
jgi:hypothetical protein